MSSLRNWLMIEAEEENERRITAMMADPEWIRGHLMDGGDVAEALADIGLAVVLGDPAKPIAPARLDALLKALRECAVFDL